MCIRDSFLTNTDQIDPFTVVSNLCGAGCVVYISLIVPTITYLYRREFETLFEYIEDNYSRLPDDLLTDQLHYVKKIDSLGQISFWSAISLFFALPSAFIGEIDVLFWCAQEDSFRDVHHHPMAFPYLDRIPSMKVALLAYVGEWIVFFMQFIMGLSQLNFTIMLATELNNIVVDYCRRIQALDAFIRSERSFEQNLASLVHQHQTFVT